MNDTLIKVEDLCKIYNPGENEVRALDHVSRLWRQGQQSKTVIIQHIITTGTIDRKIMQALQKKEETQNALIDAVKAELGGKK